MTRTLNIPALTRLKEWLEAGAPHASFNMHHGLMGTDEFDGCGTVCCIAGAAVYLEMDPVTRVAATSAAGCLSWDSVAQRALNILGLPVKPNTRGMYHPLFDPGNAPEDCTPEQAAEAVQNVIDGHEPWEDIT